MNRITAVAAGLGIVLLLVLFWLFLWKPQSDEIAELEAQIEDTQAQQATLRSRIARLEDVRSRAPEIEAALAAAESVIPRDAALASLVRQIQLAAVDSGVSLVAVNPQRPEALSENVPSVAFIDVGVQVRGSYFQIVDFLRRIEDPAISPRGMEWDTMQVQGSPDEYPTLTGTFGGTVFAILPAPPAPAADEPETEPTEPDAGASPSPSPSPTGGES